jgi:hypothetical protein
MPNAIEYRSGLIIGHIALGYCRGAAGVVKQQEV